MLYVPRAEANEPRPSNQQHLSQLMDPGRNDRHIWSIYAKKNFISILKFLVEGTSGNGLAFENYDDTVQWRICAAPFACLFSRMLTYCLNVSIAFAIIYNVATSFDIKRIHKWTNIWLC